MTCVAAADQRIASSTRSSCLDQRPSTARNRRWARERGRDGRERIPSSPKRPARLWFCSAPAPRRHHESIHHHQITHQVTPTPVMAPRSGAHAIGSGFEREGERDEFCSADQANGALEMDECV